MDPSANVNPFLAFSKYLDGEREAVGRLAEVQAKRKNNEHHRNERRRQQVLHASKRGTTKYHKCAYPTHRKDTINHTTAE